MFAITKWSQDQCTRDNVSKIERKEKIQKILTTSLIYTPFITKISYTNPPPMSMTTLISKLLSFFVTSDKSQVHQVDILLSLGELAPSSSSASSLSMPSSLSSLDVGGDGEEATVKPPMIACRRVIRPPKASIHVHKLCHDGLKCHSTCRRRRSGGGWSGGNRRSHHLYLRLP